MSRIRFEDLPSTNTPITAENLDKLNNVIISSTEPTTGEEVWIKNGTNKEIYIKNNGSYEKFIDATVETGNIEYNSTYIDGTPDICKYAKYGNVVYVSIRAKLASSIPNQTNLFTLPYNSAVTAVVNSFVGERYILETPYFAYVSGKNIHGASFSGTNKYIHINWSYICS